MSGLLNSIVFLYAACGVVGFIGLVLVVRGLFADRACGRRRCPKCWYDMSESPTRVCSECGHEASSDGALHRTRRRWRMAVAGAILVIAGPAGVLAPTIREDGWVSVAPTTILILAVREAQTASDPAFSELCARIDPGGSGGADPDALWNWQWRSLIRDAIGRGAYAQGADWKLDPSMSLPPSNVHDDLLVRVIEAGLVARVGLIDELAAQYPVKIAVAPVLDERSAGATRLQWEMQATPSFPYIKYRITATPLTRRGTQRPAWLPGELTYTGMAGIGYATALADGSLPGGPGLPEEVAFHVLVEYAPVGIYGSFGPEEFAVYDRFEVVATIEAE